MSRRKEYRRGVLSPARIAALEEIAGWEWNPHEQAWHRMFAYLTREAEQHGSIAHLTQRSLIDGAPIGRWIMTQRSKHRQGRLSTARIRALAALPGWNWASRASAPTDE